MSEFWNMSLQTFSEYFGLNKGQHELDFVDVLVNDGDVPLFIDPYAISTRRDRWSIQCQNLIMCLSSMPLPKRSFSPLGHSKI